MNSKALFSKIVEFTLGVAVVIALVFVVLSIYSVSANAAADVANKAAMKNLISLSATSISKGSSGTAATSTGWALKPSPTNGNIVYSIVFVDSTTARFFKGEEGAGLFTDLFNQKDKFAFNKCAPDGEACYCLLKIEFEKADPSCADMSFNVLTVPYTSSGLAPAEDYSATKFAIEYWTRIHFLRMPKRIIESAHVIECVNIKNDMRCTHNNENPCLIFYDGNPLVWMSTSGGKQIKTEVVKVDPMPFAGDIAPNMKFVQAAELQAMNPMTSGMQNMYDTLTVDINVKNDETFEPYNSGCIIYDEVIAALTAIPRATMDNLLNAENMEDDV